MKKYKNLLLVILFITILSTGSAIDSKAQANWEAGIRFGQDFAIDATIPLSTKPRLHVAAYFGGPESSDFGLGGYFDWMFSLDGGPTGLKFYPGVGPEIYFGDDFNIGVAGDFGAEYSFDFPLTIGIDWRPGVMFTNDIGFHGGNWGFVARFRFGEGVSFRAE